MAAGDFAQAIFPAASDLLGAGKRAIAIGPALGKQVPYPDGHGREMPRVAVSKAKADVADFGKDVPGGSTRTPQIYVVQVETV